MYRFSIFKAALAALCVCLLASCASRKDFVYLQDMRTGADYPVNVRHETMIQPNDRLAISVSSKNPELSLPFNQVNGSFRLSADGSVQTVSNAAQAGMEKGYRVDADGNITFPILGKLHVSGLSLDQATELVRNGIVQGNYIKDPLVTIEFVNFRYTVLGAVGSAGTYNVQGDRVTILEAIARAGDLQPKARQDRITVIREQDGQRRVYVQDIRSKSIFDSPAFYLQQNDVVYVEPKYNKKDREDRGWQYATFFTSLVSLATSILWAIK